jgi:hypothetical protein
MSHIAKDDRAHMKRHALIHSLYDEIENKVKTLSHEVKENPGLRPVLDRYVEHIKSRQDEARALQEYFHFLLQSLYTIDKDKDKDKDKDNSHHLVPEHVSGSKKHSSHSSKIIKQLQVDEKAILFELDKWTEKTKTR